MRKIMALLFVVAAVAVVVLASAPLSQQYVPLRSDPPIMGFGPQGSSNEDFLPASEPEGGRPGHNPLDVVDSLLHIDDFEGGHAAWTSVDVQQNEVEWHPSAYHALGATGTSWWCGDEATHSYGDHWLQYLILPVVDLSSAPAPVLALKARWSMEVPGGEPAGQGYDMWDAWNVWGSTDGGTTWSVLQPSSPNDPTNTNGDPAATNYTGASSFAFGSEWGMGTNIPGYGGNVFSNLTYTEVLVPLTALIGSANARLRIAFCSDPLFPSNADSLYFGLHVDSIRVTDGALATTLYSNDGTDDGQITFAVGPVSPDVWVFEADTSHSPTHSWNAEQTAYGVTRSIQSYGVILPAGYQKLKIAFYVWCDLPDADGNNDGFLEDFYYIRSSTDNGETWDADGALNNYDYAFDYGDPPPGGDSQFGWVYRTHGVGTTDFNLFQRTDASQPETVLVAIEANFDLNDDGGIGTGVHIDDVEFIAVRAQAIDLATQNMKIGYPTTLGLLRPWTFDFKNEGLNPIGPVLGRLRYFLPDGSQLPPGGTDSSIVSAGVLNYQETRTINKAFTPSQLGGWRIRVRSTAVGEQDPTNDTTWSPPIPYGPILLHSDSTLGIWVRPAGVYELGYCPQRRVTNASSGHRYQHFTPQADGVPAGDAANYDLLQIRVIWRYDDEIPAGGATSLIQFWNEGVNDTTPGSLIHSITTQIDTNETVGAGLMSRWWTMNLTQIPALHNRSGNFWVSVAAQDTSATDDPIPIPLCFREPNGTAHDNHNFLLTPGNPDLTRSLNRNIINVVIGDAVEDLVIHRGVYPSNDIILNWTTSVGATKYYVWRLTTPNQPYNTGTNLTPAGIVTNTYTDVGRAGASAKDFYVVITEY